MGYIPEIRVTVVAAQILQQIVKETDRNRLHYPDEVLEVLEFPNLENVVQLESRHQNQIHHSQTSTPVSYIVLAFHIGKVLFLTMNQSTKYMEDDSICSFVRDCIQ